jgi:hypothetical protein
LRRFAVTLVGVSTASRLRSCDATTYFFSKSDASRSDGGSQRILLEPRGSRRLSSQSLLDVRVSRSIPFGHGRRGEILFDVLNALNDTGEESLATDNLSSPNFGRPSIFIDPRRAMIGMRLNLGRP